MTPLLLLNVDGVLNAFGGDAGDLAAWQEWSAGWATADGGSWHITFAPAVMSRLVSWQDEGLVELQWLTTWGHDANGQLRALLEMPRLAVAGTYQDEDEAGAPATSAGVTHAAAAPSAPDPLSGGWWKYDVVRRLVAAEPERLLIWVDDELTPGSPYRAWADDQPQVRAVGPDPAGGLSPADLDSIARHLSQGEEVDSRRCRHCDGKVVPIAYGYPGGDTWEAAERGTIVLGGCLMSPERATSRCARCGTDATWERAPNWT